MFFGDLEVDMYPYCLVIGMEEMKYLAPGTVLLGHPSVMGLETSHGNFSVSGAIHGALVDVG